MSVVLAACASVTVTGAASTDTLTPPTPRSARISLTPTPSPFMLTGGTRDARAACAAGWITLVRDFFTLAPARVRA